MDDYFRREREAFFANYFPKERTGESVVYIHKKYLRPQPVGPSVGNLGSEKLTDNKQGNPLDKHDKLQQLTAETGTKCFKTLTKDNAKPKLSNDTVLEQTIKLAKDIASTIPDKDKCFYTIRVKKRNKKTKEKSKTETPQKEIDRKKDSYRHSSIKESRHTTIEELHINQSLSCSLSEISAKKTERELVRTSKRRDTSQDQKDKLIASESLQALATELAGMGETKIKIHLMDDADKSLFAEGIQAPIIKAIKNCLAEFNKNRDTEINVVQKVVKSNSDKIDSILNKMTNIESKLSKIENVTAETVIKNKTEKVLSRKTEPKSTLEELAQDVEDENVSFEDTEQLEKQKKPETVVVSINASARSNFGSGEQGMPQESTRNIISRLVKPERPVNKIPTRFCWTDATKKS